MALLGGVSFKIDFWGGGRVKEQEVASPLWPQFTHLWDEKFGLSGVWGLFQLETSSPSWGKGQEWGQFWGNVCGLGGRVWPCEDSFPRHGPLGQDRAVPQENSSTAGGSWRAHGVSEMRMGRKIRTLKPGFCPWGLHTWVGKQEHHSKARSSEGVKTFLSICWFHQAMGADSGLTKGIVSMCGQLSAAGDGRMSASPSIGLPHHLPWSLHFFSKRVFSLKYHLIRAFLWCTLSPQDASSWKDG